MLRDPAERDRRRAHVLLQPLQEGLRHFGLDQPLEMGIAVRMIVADHLHEAQLIARVAAAQADRPPCDRGEFSYSPLHAVDRPHDRRSRPRHPTRSRLETAPGAGSPKPLNFLNLFCPSASRIAVATSPRFVR